MKYVVEGEMILARDRFARARKSKKVETRKFSKEIEAPTERVAREHTYADLGSRHGLNRNKIKITSVNEKK